MSEQLGQLREEWETQDVVAEQFGEDFGLVVLAKYREDGFSLLRYWKSPSGVWAVSCDASDKSSDEIIALLMEKLVEARK